VHLASLSLRGVKSKNMIWKGKTRRSYAEVMTLTVNFAEECFGLLTKLVARVPSWLKEASIESDK
jgi:hypothetical protein